MSLQDRRSGQERRTSNRYPIELDIEWESTAGRVSGTISDVSLDGCFVLSSGNFEDGDRVKLFVPLDDGMNVQFDGNIVNNVYEIGFGVKFDQLSVAQRDLLLSLVREAEKG